MYALEYQTKCVSCGVGIAQIMYLSCSWFHRVIEDEMLLENGLHH